MVHKNYCRAGIKYTLTSEKGENKEETLFLANFILGKSCLDITIESCLKLLTALNLNLDFCLSVSKTWLLGKDYY